MADTLVPLSLLSDQPLYNIKAICQRTGLTMATLRAWERRYSIPVPQRTQQGYRLYSERDLAVLFWLVQRIESGLNIGRAASELHALLNGRQELLLQNPTFIPANDIDDERPRSPEIICDEVTLALAHLDAQSMETLLTEASALYTPETLLIDIMARAMQRLRQQVDGGILSNVAWGYASNAVQGRLFQWMQMLPAATMRCACVLIGFLDEHTEIDLMILSLLIRRQGWSASYLSNDLEPKSVIPTLTDDFIRLIVFYVETVHNAERLLDLPVMQAESDRHIAYAGHVPEPALVLNERLNLDYLGADLRGVLGTILERLTV